MFFVQICWAVLCPLVLLTIFITSILFWNYPVFQNQVFWNYPLFQNQVFWNYPVFQNQVFWNYDYIINLFKVFFWFKYCSKLVFLNYPFHLKKLFHLEYEDFIGFCSFQNRCFWTIYNPFSKVEYRYFSSIFIQISKILFSLKCYF